MATKAQKEKLVEVLKFTPRTYKIRLWGYGGEMVLGEITKKTWDYFREHRIDVSDYATDSDFGEELDIPEDCQPFYSGEWHDCDNLYHGWGVSKNAGTMEIEDENGEIVYTRDLDGIDGCDVMLSCNEEAWIAMKGNNSYVFYNYSSEKGTFFEGEIELKMPFDPEKLCIHYDDVEGDELITRIEYDEQDIDNFGGDTTGKGYDFKFYHVDNDGEIESYADGNDVDENFDDGTPPSGPSPDAWEKTVKMTGVNPVYTGWYGCNYANGSTYGSLYWNNEQQQWEDYYHGRITSTYKTVNYWYGYNWDTSDWANRPPEPPAVRCKTCDWIGDRDQLIEDEDYTDHCPECNGKKIEWIDYDPNEKKGQKNRKKYCITIDDFESAKELDALKLEFEQLMSNVDVPTMRSALDQAIDKLAAEHEGFPTAAELDKLEQMNCVQCEWTGSVEETNNDEHDEMVCPKCGEPVEFTNGGEDMPTPFPGADNMNPWAFNNNEPREEPTLTHWTVKTLDKKSIEEVEYFTKDGMKLVHRTGWRWGEWTVSTNDGNPPEFDLDYVPGGDGAKDSIDMNSCYINNIEETEMNETWDGCWDDIEWPDDIDPDEQSALEEAIDEDGYYSALEDNGWWHDDTEMWIWGPIAIKDADENIVRIVEADKDGNAVYKNPADYE